MKPENMTLGELICKYIHACNNNEIFGVVNNLRTELVVRLNMVEINTQRPTGATLPGGVIKIEKEN